MAMGNRTIKLYCRTEVMFIDHVRIDWNKGAIPKKADVISIAMKKRYILLSTPVTRKGLFIQKAVFDSLHLP